MAATQQKPLQPQSTGEGSPALLLARRVRSEQGVEQLKAYLLAVEPFVAPNEIRTISAAFGLNFDSLQRPDVQRSGSSQSGFQENGAGSGSRNQFQMLQMLMNMQNMMKSGGDISQLMKMMGGR